MQLSGTRVARHVALGGAVLALMAMAWGALAGGIRQIPRVETFGQRVETTIQIGCGLLSLFTALTCFWWRRWSALVRGAWLASLVLGAGLSAIVWGPPMPWIAGLMAMAAMLLAFLLIGVMRFGGAI